MRYDAEIDLRNGNTSHAILVELVGSDRRVLDVGCASGHLGRALKRRGCRVAGVERNPEAAAAAEEALDEVLAGDVEELDLVGHFGKESFDVVVFGDVLEHLADPVAALRKVRPLLTETGSIIASIPNVAHGAVRLALLKGRFEYRPRGLLDSAHLRFFTRGSVYETLREAGLVPLDVRRTTVGVFDTEIGVRREDFEHGVVDAVEGDPESTTYQFVLRAVPEESPEAIAAWPANQEPADGTRARVAVCADWAPDDLRTALAVRVAAAELARRLPGAIIRVASAGADPRPSPHDGGLVVEAPTGGWWTDLDCVVVTGDVRGSELPLLPADAECPMVWSAVRDAGGAVPTGSCVVDETSVDPAAHPPGGGMETVPDPLLLVPRLLPANVLARRLHYARAMGWFPATGDAVVVELVDALVPHAAAVARALDGVVAAAGVSVVLVGLEAGPGAVDAVAEALATPAYRVPADALVDDVVAVVAGATALAASSRTGMALGLAYGVPMLRVEEARVRDRRLDGLDALVAGGANTPQRPSLGVEALQAALDAHFDRVAAIADATAQARPDPPERSPAAAPGEHVAALAEAHRRIRDRLVAERLVVADLLEGYEAEYGGARDLARRLRTERDDLERRLAEASARLDEFESEVGRHRAELDALRNTKVLRLLRPARAVYARLRGGRL